MSWLLVVVGAAVGAPARYLIDRWVQRRHDSAFPWGTLTVNVGGSFILGLLAAGVAAGAVSSPTMLALGTGLCGALTTYSTFGYETVRLLQHARGALAAANVVLSVAAGLAAAAGGALLGAALWR